MKARLEQELAFHQTALNLRAHRQQLLASNIANADTPNFKAKDIDFRSALAGALGNRLGPLALSRTAAGHLPAAADPALDRFARFRTEIQPNVDGNTVDMDVERAAFAENALHYEASVTFINGLLTGMQRAIVGQ
ncbi:MAG: flagellar basal body rod protein FlgB [Rhodocyclaceae bacterium]|nr:flagellar basal body rod protein FlgB [Rhodocyclaceae bacterium]